MADIQSAAAEIRRGIKKIEDRKKPQGRNIMPHLLRRAAITNNVMLLIIYSTVAVRMEKSRPNDKITILRRPILSHLSNRHAFAVKFV